MNTSQYNDTFGEIGAHSLSDPLFFMLIFGLCLFTAIGRGLGYVIGHTIDEGINHVKKSKRRN